MIFNLLDVWQFGYLTELQRLCVFTWVSKKVFMVISGIGNKMVHVIQG